ncbi:hypothetical protein [Orientia tsutsugamushi]|uniref:Uncharacterized protein n=1 Tax=Orientia tsutsugamushi str. TA716 TaxID=1359175 RepID=A0A0F3NTM4_ORITS|nr:hypothetical protein [Orientia tsutsugamushi]KJV71430.1 hypothetical protein OTSTA716_2262 [Orientia tsutsugamushi str. TA716]
MENIVLQKADTPDKCCYRDKAEKLSCRRNMQPSLKRLAPRYKEDSQLNISLMSETW